MPKVCYYLLLNLTVCKGLKLAIVLLSFNSVAYLYSGHILLSLSLVLDSGKPCLRLGMDQVYLIKSNICHIVKTPNSPRVRYHQCANFDLLDSILLQPKQQPDTNLKERFEVANEPQLHWITGDIVIIKTK